MLVLKVECVTVNVSIHRIEVYMRGKKKQTNPNKKKTTKKICFLKQNWKYCRRSLAVEEEGCQLLFLTSFLAANLNPQFLFRIANVILKIDIILLC